MNNQEQNHISFHMRSFELALKKYWESNLTLQLDIPHYVSELPNDFLSLINESPYPLSDILQDNLDESSFFHNGLDVEFYQHLRYLPALWHSHGFFEIVYVLKGNCCNYIYEQELSLFANDICIIAPNTKHAISNFSDDCILVNVVLRITTFEDAFFGTLSENDILSDFFTRNLYHDKSNPYILFHTNANTKLSSYFSSTYKEYISNHEYKRQMINSMFTIFFIYLLRNFGTNVVLPPKTRKGNEDILYLLKYIQEHYKTISLKELSTFFNYSERQLQRIIKDNTGYTYTELIQNKKMKQAMKLLTNSNKSISTIALELGYNDIANFRQIFKKHYGKTPLAFRQ